MTANRASYPAVSTAASYKHLSDIPERLKRFTGGSSRHSALISSVAAERLTGSKHVAISVWSAPGQSRPPFDEATKQHFRHTKIGESFGPAWTNHWFKLELSFPPEWRNHPKVQLEFDSSGEAMVYTEAGEIQHGLTGGFGRDRRVEYIIPSNIVASGTATYYLEASCNAMFGQATLENPDPNNVGQDILDTAGDDERFYRLNCADLVVINVTAQKLLWDYVAIQQLSTCLAEGSALRNRAQRTANKIVNAFRSDDSESFARCRRLAEDILGTAWESNMEAKAVSTNRQGRIWALGHCHIDTAWLWPIEVTQQKSARSWSTQCDLMDRYPEHRFCATQAQQYKWVQQLYPGLFDRIKKKVKAGCFQPVGCTWVEMDVNMPSGEALCRQFLYGQRYFEREFGTRSHTCVLPDTFGYCAQLPQIIRLADAQDFFTIKLSWNAFNKFPHSTFNWVGLDGSQVLAHLSPTDSYSSQGDMEEICQAATAHKNLEVTDQSVFLFGNGDGGGGPTPVMLEKLRRARAIVSESQSGGEMPWIRMGGTFGQFFDAVRDETDNGAALPSWRGEMYFECHRGTYTTHAAIKRGNRKNEILVRQAEYAASMASLVGDKTPYPFDQFDAVWEDLLLCQFHDVLPGSGIAMIYHDAKRKYAKMERALTSIIADSYRSLFGLSLKASSVDSMVAVNTLPGYARQQIMTVSDSAEEIQSQLVLLEAGPDQPLAYPAHLPSTVSAVSIEQPGPDCFILRNDSLQMTMTSGRITSILDRKAQRELIHEGSSAGLVVMEDIPNNYDAWDIDSFHLEKQEHLAFKNVRVLENGPLRGVLGAEISWGGITIKIKISLDAVAASMGPNARSLIRFDATVDWRASHTILKFEMPTTILAEEAIYDVQFGFVKRPTHRNTSHDAAKFEVCGHTFADVSEYGYGVAILNDCKYGYAACGNLLTLSLLRAPKSPDPDADMGIHEFSWAIYPHLNTFIESDVAEVAAAFNAPMKGYSTGMPADLVKNMARNPFEIVGAPNVVLETVKRGEADREEGQSVVLRLVERRGGQASVRLVVHKLHVNKAEIVNILEDHVEPLKIAESSLDGRTELLLGMRGFEIKTVKLYI